jgi:UDP-N-acetylglucosamine--N-acetylmuramyl-(pentapeptide) pyrophosphoryl-undecaprenol N-acetylglucosamine transferase
MTEARGGILLAGGGTGGHVFPMVAVADALRALSPELPISFVGTERGMETRVVPARGYALELVNVLPLRGGGAAGAVRGTLRAALAVRESYALLRRLAPRAVLSIGGYAAGPISLAARTLGLPLAVMEPNGVIGLANRLLAPFVARAYTAFGEVEHHFRQSAVLRAGVPIRGGFQPRPYARQGRALRVLVLGGSQGARALNEAVPQALGRARTPVRVVHQSGGAHADEVAERYARLGGSELAQVAAFIDDMPAALAASDLVVSRAGASAVSEICAVGRPSLLVPYPYAAGDHQRKNAEALAKAGAAVCVASDDATPERIASEIDRLAADETTLPAMAEAARRRGRPDAADAIARDLLGLAGLQPRSGNASAPHAEAAGGQR